MKIPELIQCSKCKGYVEKRQLKWHMKDHKYSNNGRMV